MYNKLPQCHSIWNCYKDDIITFFTAEAIGFWIAHKLVLPHDHGIGVQVLNVNQARLDRIQLWIVCQEPANMGVEESSGCIVWIQPCITKFMMDPMPRGPLKNWALQQNKLSFGINIPSNCQKPSQSNFSLETTMRPKSMSSNKLKRKALILIQCTRNLLSS